MKDVFRVTSLSNRRSFDLEKEQQTDEAANVNKLTQIQQNNCFFAMKHSNYCYITHNVYIRCQS